MNTGNAALFVQKMREDTGFRHSVAGLSAPAELGGFLERNGFDFNMCDLVKAMAACMAESDQIP
jgi:hypothetical protein